MLAIAVLYAAYFFVMPIVGHYLTRFELGPSFELALALLLGQALLFVLTIAFTPWAQAHTVLALRSVPLRWGRITGAALLYVGISLVLGLVSLVIMEQLGLPLESVRQEVLQDVVQATDPLFVWLTPVALAVIAPFGEELFFRGLVYGLLRPAGVAWATGVSAVAFALLHLEPAAFIGHLGFGVYLALLRENTRSIWPSIATHGVANLAIYVLAQAAGQFA